MERQPQTITVCVKYDFISCQQLALTLSSQAVTDWSFQNNPTDFRDSTTYML